MAIAVTTSRDGRFVVVIAEVMAIVANSLTIAAKVMAAAAKVVASSAEIVAAESQVLAAEAETQLAAAKIAAWSLPQLSLHTNLSDPVKTLLKQPQDGKLRSHQGPWARNLGGCQIGQAERHRTPCGLENYQERAA